MQIDAHQHFWKLDVGDHTWLTPDMAPIYRDFLPQDLSPILARHDIAKTILMQAAPTLGDTLFLLKLANIAKAAGVASFVAGVVGWVGFEATQAPSLIARFAGDPLLVGLRPMVHDIADPDWLLRDAIAPAVEAMLAHGLVFDALVRPPHLQALLGFTERYPDLPVVIDHGAKPEIAHGAIEPWLSHMRALAANPRIVCKLSGLITEAGPDWRPDDVLPYCDRLLQLFGPERLLWGSDWPVVNLAGGYDVWRALTAQALQHLGPAERAAVLGGNAARVYLGRGRGVPDAQGN